MGVFRVRGSAARPRLVHGWRFRAWGLNKFELGVEARVEGLGIMGLVARDCAPSELEPALYTGYELSPLA